MCAGDPTDDSPGNIAAGFDAKSSQSGNSNHSSLYVVLIVIGVAVFILVEAMIAAAIWSSINQRREGARNVLFNFIFKIFLQHRRPEGFQQTSERRCYADEDNEAAASRAYKLEYYFTFVAKRFYLDMIKLFLKRKRSHDFTVDNNPKVFIVVALVSNRWTMTVFY